MKEKDGKAERVMREKVETTRTREVRDTFPTDFLFFCFCLYSSLRIKFYYYSRSMYSPLLNLTFSSVYYSIIITLIQDFLFKINLSFIELTNKKLLKKE